MKIRWRNLHAVLTLICLLFGFTASAYASDFKFIQHQNTMIGVNQAVDDVVTIGGDADIRGTVRDTVIVVNGDLNIARTAHIAGIILVIGGSIHQELGANISNDVFNISFDSPTLNSIFIGISLLIGFWILRLIISILLVFISPIIELFIKRHMSDLETVAKESPQKLITVGFVTSILIIAVSVLLSLTIVGIPVVLVIALMTALSFCLGISVISSVIGEELPYRTVGTTSWLNNVKGAILLTAALNVPLIGFLFFLMLLWLSLGMVILWFKERRTKKRVEA